MSPLIALLIIVSFALISAIAFPFAARRPLDTAAARPSSTTGWKLATRFYEGVWRRLDNTGED